MHDLMTRITRVSVKTLYPSCKCWKCWDVDLPTVGVLGIDPSPYDDCYVHMRHIYLKSIDRLVTVISNSCILIVLMIVTMANYHAYKSWQSWKMKHVVHDTHTAIIALGCARTLVAKNASSSTIQTTVIKKKNYGWSAECQPEFQPINEVVNCFCGISERKAVKLKWQYQGLPKHPSCMGFVSTLGSGGSDNGLRQGGKSARA